MKLLTRRLLLMSSLICVVSGMALFHACTSIDCPVQNKVAVYYEVKSFEGTTEVADTLNDTLSIWTVRINRTDTLILNRAVNTSAFSLPASYNCPEDTLMLRIANTDSMVWVDTLWLKKDDIPHFESVDCSPHFFHKITAVRSTHNAIDTVIINNPSVTYDPTVVNLHIHFKADR